MGDPEFGGMIFGANGGGTPGGLTDAPWGNATGVLGEPATEPAGVPSGTLVIAATLTVGAT